MASNTDKLRKSYSFLQKSLGGSIGDSDNSLTLNNYTNIPTDTAVDFIIDRIDANGNRTNDKREIVTGVCTGSAITGLVRGVHGTTAQAHDGGAIVEFVTSAAAWNDLIDAVLEEHNQDGSHGDVTADSVSTDTINEGSSGHGVDIDGLNVKDGKITTPAAIDNSALAQGAVEPSNLNLAPQTAIVTTSESTSSTSYTDLTTTTDTVTVDIGDNGLALLSFGGQIVNADSFISYEISGANTVAAADANGIYTNTANVVLYKTILLTGLTAGSSTFKLKYKAGSASSKSFLRRSISVIPL